MKRPAGATVRLATSPSALRLCAGTLSEASAHGGHRPRTPDAPCIRIPRQRTDRRASPAHRFPWPSVNCLRAPLFITLLLQRPWPSRPARAARAADAMSDPPGGRKPRRGQQPARAVGTPAGGTPGSPGEGEAASRGKSHGNHLKPFSISRPAMWTMIWSVPPPMRLSRASRQKRDTRQSSM
jgi:hypothetical protein